MKTETHDVLAVRRFALEMAMQLVDAKTGYPKPTSAAAAVKSAQAFEKFMLGKSR